MDVVHFFVLNRRKQVKLWLGYVGMDLKKSV